MKLSVKKKIIVPLLFLIIMPMIALMILTYLNNNKIINNYETVKVNTELNDLLILLNKVEKTDMNKDFMKEYIKSLNKRKREYWYSFFLLIFRIRLLKRLFLFKL